MEIFDEDSSDNIFVAGIENDEDEGSQCTGVDDEEMFLNDVIYNILS